MSVVQRSFDCLFSSNPEQGASNVSADGGSFNVRLDSDGFNIPPNALNPEIQVVSAELWWNTPNITEENNQISFNGIIRTIPVGLYDLPSLNSAVAYALGGTLSNSELTFTSDDAQGKVRMTFKEAGKYVDFSIPKSFHKLLGFDASRYPKPTPTNPTPVSTAGQSFTGQNQAGFSNVAYFLLQSSLIGKGILTNGNYNQIIAKILIPKGTGVGSQILYEPQNPTLIDASALKGDTGKRSYRFALLDSNGNQVDTLGEYWSLQVRVSYYEPVNFNLF